MFVHTCYALFRCLLSGFKVDLGAVMKIRKALVQGAKDGKGFVKSFTVSTRDNEGLPWKPYKQADKTKVRTLVFSFI